jgi:hypothetical protein
MLIAMSDFTPYNSETVYPKDSGRTIATLDLWPTQELSIRFDVKIMKRNSAYLVLEKGGVEVFRYSDNWRTTGKEARVSLDGVHDMKVYFTDPTADRRTAEIEIDWIVR